MIANLQDKDDDGIGYDRRMMIYFFRKVAGRSSGPG